MGGRSPNFPLVFLLFLYETAQAYGGTSTERISRQLSSDGLAVGGGQRANGEGWDRQHPSFAQTTSPDNEAEHTNPCLKGNTSAVISPSDGTTFSKVFQFNTLVPRDARCTNASRTRRTEGLGSHLQGLRRVLPDTGGGGTFLQIYARRGEKYSDGGRDCYIGVSPAVKSSLKHHHPAFNDQATAKGKALSSIFNHEVGSRNDSVNVSQNTSIRAGLLAVGHPLRPSLLDARFATKLRRKRLSQQVISHGGVLLQDASTSRAIHGLTPPETTGSPAASFGREETTYDPSNSQSSTSAPTFVDHANDATRRSAPSQTEAPDSAEKNSPTPDVRDWYVHTPFRASTESLGSMPENAGTPEASKGFDGASTDSFAKEPPTAGNDVEDSSATSATSGGSQQVSHEQVETPQWATTQDDAIQETSPILQPLPVSPTVDSRSFRVPGNMTEGVYQQELATQIEETTAKCGRCTPVIHFRWHSQESFVEAAYHVRNAAGRPYFYVVAGEYAETPIRHIGLFQKAFISTLGPIRQWWPAAATKEGDEEDLCPYVVPSVQELFATLPEDSTGPVSLAQETPMTSRSTEESIGESDGDTVEQTNTNSTGGGSGESDGDTAEQTNTNSTGGSSGESDGDTAEQTDNEGPRGPILLRWIPFGLKRQIPCRHGNKVISSETSEIRDVDDFLSALRQKLTVPVHTPDGREVIVIVNDRLPEMELILRNALKFAPGGTPVIVTDTEAFSPLEIFSRIKLRSPLSEKMHFVVLGYGRYGQLPLDTAFLDRAVVRIPKADDIRAFVEELASDSAQLPAANGNSAVVGTREKDADTKSSLQAASVASSDNFFMLNPFVDLLMRFNYAEVDSVLKYAAGLSEELRETPITFHYKNETRRVAIVLLTDFPEAENAFPSGLTKLAMMVQATIAVATIIAFLTCLCMCRMVYLLKSR